MKRLPPDKRNKLILVILGTLTLIGMVYFLLIDPQGKQNRDLAIKTSANLANFQNMEKSLKQSGAIAAKLQDISTLLGSAEADMASGDIFSWTYDTFRQFKVNRHVEITNIGQPVQTDVDMLPDFPYKQIKFIINGNGYFHDIGKFIADLENKFPHMRVVSLTIDSATGPDAPSEQLSFRMEIAALVKPNS